MGIATTMLVDGKYYIFTNAMETQVIDGAEWNVKKTRFGEEEES